MCDISRVQQHIQESSSLKIQLCRRNQRTPEELDLGQTGSHGFVPLFVWFQCNSLFFKVQFTLSTALLRGCVHLSMFGTLSARVRRQTGFHDFQEDNGSDRGHCVRASDVTFLKRIILLTWSGVNKDTLVDLLGGWTHHIHP